MGKNKLKALEYGKDYSLLLYSYQKVNKNKFFKCDIKDITFTSSGAIKIILGDNTFYGYYSGLPKTGIHFETLQQYYADKEENLLLNGNNYDLLKVINKDNIDWFYCIKSEYNDNLYILYFRLKTPTQEMDIIKNDIGQVVYNPFWGTMVQPKGYNTIDSIDDDIIIGNFQSNLGVISNWFNNIDTIWETPQSIKRKEEKKIMANNNNLFGNLRTGQAGSNYAITYFGGIAFKGKTYYNGKIFEADGLTFPFDMLYFVPATEVKKDDIIEKDGIAYHITDVDKTGTIIAINLVNGKEETLIPGGPFGMSMYSKLFNPFGQMKGDNAFGNMMLMQAMFNGDGGSNNAMMMAMLMSQGGFQLPSFQMPAMPKAAEDK